jgi:hypothetical protein
LRRLSETRAAAKAITRRTTRAIGFVKPYAVTEQGQAGVLQTEVGAF